MYTDLKQSLSPRVHSVKERKSYVSDYQEIDSLQSIDISNWTDSSSAPKVCLSKLLKHS